MPLRVKNPILQRAQPCHGLHAEGYMPLQSPSLRVLGSDYLTAQMGSYVNGWRGVLPKSEQPAVWMHSIANQVLDATQLANIFAYVATLAK
jgi:cytochrome c553